MTRFSAIKRGPTIFDELRQIPLHGERPAGNPDRAQKERRTSST